MGKLMIMPMQTESQFKICTSIARKIIAMHGDQHEIYVIVGKDWEERLAEMCPEIKRATFHHPNEELQKEWLARTGKNKNEVIANLCEDYIRVWNNPQRKIDMVDAMAGFYENFLSHIVKVYPFVTEIVRTIQPDFIIQCFQISTPLCIDQNIPYALFQTCSPTFFGSEFLPPPLSDCPSEPTLENRRKWSEFFDQAHLLRHCELKAKFNNWLKAHRCPNLDERMFYLVESPYFNIQLYPRELDYDVELPGKWLKMQSSVFHTPKPMEIPEKLRNLPGKIIYINLGYNQIIYRYVLDKLLPMLPQIPHRFIIQMDLEEDQLAPNMYASSQIDPLAALQIPADLTIYHGGVKIMTDSFHFGVPGVVISLYGDQIDNGRRLEDKNLGVRLYPNDFTRESLENAIERCLDIDLRRTFKEISTRSKMDNGMEAVCSEIVKYLKPRN